MTPNEAYLELQSLRPRLRTLCEAMRISHWGYSGFECYAASHQTAEELLTRLDAEHAEHEAWGGVED